MLLILQGNILNCTLDGQLCLTAPPNGSFLSLQAVNSEKWVGEQDVVITRYVGSIGPIRPGGCFRTRIFILSGAEYTLITAAPTT
ncbi:hypothetical protein E3U43_021896 [Larimichthys crocea]|uniref:Uncharacterized protein n=1 Tax=Larimichthys crocea TaxID=215358 RepID=A0ACD3R7K3_LARCR|nr:hypothetical protein E3U43_021896 [Larimichthys crocea]